MKVFVSSAIWSPTNMLLKLREDLHKWAQSSGHEIWLSNYQLSDAEWQRLTPAEAEDVCLSNVRTSDLFVAVFHGPYGSSAQHHMANVALTDLEIFEAHRMRIPIAWFVLEPFMDDADGRLLALMQILQQTVPPAGSGNNAQVFDKIVSLIERASEGRNKLPASVAPRFDALSIKLRQHDDQRGDGMRFLLDRYPPALTQGFSRDYVQHILAECRTAQSFPERVSLAWQGIVHLFKVPWKERLHACHLDLWDEVLGHWDQGAAWSGLHGFRYAGRLAGLNTLVAVRALRASEGEVESLSSILATGPHRMVGRTEEWKQLYSLGVPLASEYYSTAKMSASQETRKRLLTQACKWLAAADRALPLQESAGFECGLTSVRGHVYLQLGRLREACLQFERGLRIREAAGHKPESIGEAKADLGHLYLRMGRNRQAEALLLEGVELLERRKMKGFTARAKRKLAELYLRRGDVRKCLQQLREADAISRQFGIEVSVGVEGSLPRRALKFVSKLVPRYGALKVIETNQGYKFIEQ